MKTDWNNKIHLVEKQIRKYQILKRKYESQKRVEKAKEFELFGQAIDHIFPGYSTKKLELYLAENKETINKFLGSKTNIDSSHKEEQSIVSSNKPNLAPAGKVNKTSIESQSAVKPAGTPAGPALAVGQK
jgi:hypothetical protein